MKERAISDDSDVELGLFGLHVNQRVKRGLRYLALSSTAVSMSVSQRSSSTIPHSTPVSAGADDTLDVDLALAHRGHRLVAIERTVLDVHEVHAALVAADVRRGIGPADVTQ